MHVLRRLRLSIAIAVSTTFMLQNSVAFGAQMGDAPLGAPAAAAPALLSPAVSVTPVPDWKPGAALPGPARAADRLQMFATTEAIIQAIPLGKPLTALRPIAGDPWFVVRENRHTYWIYPLDNEHAWLAVGVSPAFQIESVQVVKRADTTSTLTDGQGISLGSVSAKMRLPAGAVTVSKDRGEPRSVPAASHAVRFYGIDRAGNVDRFGLSLGDATTPLILRWYRWDGTVAARAVPYARYANIGEAAYLNLHPAHSMVCPQSQSWHILSHKRLSFGGVPIDEVMAECGLTRVRHAAYFDLSDVAPHGFDADPWEQKLYHGTVGAQVFRDAIAAREIVDQAVPGGAESANHAAPALSGTPALWYDKPMGVGLCADSFCDILLRYIDSPASPLTSLTVNSSLVDFSSGYIGLAHRAHVAARKAHPALSDTSLMCSCADGTAKCDGDVDYANGDGYFAVGDNGTTAGPQYYSGAPDPSQLPHCPHCNGESGSTGGPVDAVSGALFYDQQDATLSGPQPLSFFRHYQSTYAQGAVSGGPAQQPPTDMGVGWRNAYDAFLDLTQAANGTVNYNRSDAGVEFFQTPTTSGTSGTSYDPQSGDQLTTNTDGTFTLVTWNGQTLQFDTNGYVTSIADRIGNTQTVTHNSDHTVNTVTDVLGRTLSFGYDAHSRITGITSSPSGVSLAFTYDSGTNCYTGELCSAEESDGSTWTYEYVDPSTTSGYSLLQYVIDPLGHTEEYNQYALTDLGNGDNHYRVTQQQKNSGAETRSYSYSASGRTGTTAITDSLGSSHTSTYTWDQLLQQVSSVSGPLCNCNGNTKYFTYDTLGRLLTTAKGTSSNITEQRIYGRDVIYTSPDGSVSYPEYAYPSPSEIDHYNVKTNAGYQTRKQLFSYYALSDPRKDLPETVTESSVDTPGNTVTTTLTYSTAGLLTSLARQGYVNGTSTTYTASATYDGKGRVQTITGPRTDVTQTTTYSYYPDTDSDYARRGQLESVTDAAGHETSFAMAASPHNTYTIYGEPLSAIDPNGVTRISAYDARGRLTSSTLDGVTGDPANLTTTLAYDALGKLTQITKPLGNAVASVYDGNNNLTNTILLDASGHQHDQMVMSYDGMNRLDGDTAQSCTTPAASCSSWTTQYADTRTLTGLDQLQSLTYPSVAGSTSFTYSNTGDLTSKTIGDSSYSSTDAYTYDPQHNRLQHVLGGSALAMSYDLQFNRNVISPANGIGTSYQYDDFGRIEKRVSPFSGTTTYGYDPAGNVTSKTDGNGATTATTYDVLNRPLQAVSSRTGYTSETVTWTYDDTTSGHFGIGRMESMTDPSGSTTYTYERRGNIASEVQVAGGTTYTTQYAYDGNGNRNSITLPSTRVLTYSFDYADRPESVVAGSTTYVSSATYEPFGPLSTLVFGNGTTQTRSFTQRYLLSEDKVTKSSTTLADQTFSENAAGYITGITDALNSGYNQTLGYGGQAGNMLTSDQSGSSLWGLAQYSDTYNQNIATISLTASRYGLTYARSGLLSSIYNNDTNTSTAVTEDGAGNELTVGSSDYVYSPRNHLASGDGVTYTYDGFGRRVTAAVSGTGTRVSLYDPSMHLQTESALSSGSIAYDYIWFGNIPVAQEDVGGSTHWTVTDYRGAPYLQTNSSGGVYWQADYAPFGAVYALRTSDAHQPLRLPGQEAEEFTNGNANGYTGRFYNGFRWYRPLIGRYTQADPLDYGNGQFGLYGYAANNPVAYVDQYGLVLITTAGPNGITFDYTAGNAYVAYYTNAQFGHAAIYDPVSNTFVGYNPLPVGSTNEQAMPDAVMELTGSTENSSNVASDIDDFVNSEDDGSAYHFFGNNCVDAVDETLQYAGFSGGDIGDTYSNPLPIQYFSNLPGEVIWSQGTAKGNSPFAPAYGGGNSYDLVAPY